MYFDTTLKTFYVELYLFFPSMEDLLLNIHSIYNDYICEGCLRFFLFVFCFLFEEDGKISEGSLAGEILPY